MKEKKDYFAYLLGIGGLFLSILALFAKDNTEKLTWLSFGIAGMVVTVVILYTNKFRNRMESIESEVSSLKKEYEFSEQLRDIKHEIEKLKKDKKAKNTDMEDLIKIALLLIIIYLILKALKIL